MSPEILKGLKVNKYFCILIIIKFSVCVQAQSKLACYADSFNILNTRIRDQTIGKAKARKLAAHYLNQIKVNYNSTQVLSPPDPEWYFPLNGYDRKAIGGINGNGYIPKGYNYFDGNNHLGHPAHDIFIRDANQDLMDDRSQRDVPVVSITSGVVVAIEKYWKPDSELRGGKYIYIFDPVNQLLFYYAHNSTVQVQVCDVITAGKVIGTVGRSGKNAFKKRSPTHLHLMVLKTENNNFLNPVNIYEKLKTARTLKQY